MGDVTRALCGLEDFEVTGATLGPRPDRTSRNR